jgi:hypothetical protein
MSGDELITITIEDPHSGKRMSTRYSILQADACKLLKGEYHTMMLDALIERFNTEKENEIQNKRND